MIRFEREETPVAVIIRAYRPGDPDFFASLIIPPQCEESAEVDRFMRKVMAAR